MLEEKHVVEERFYRECAELLCVPHSYKPFGTSAHYKRRWYNRNPGNGRFEGCGLIRMYSPTLIHVCLKRPMKINKWFESPDDVLKMLKEFVADHNMPL